MRRWRLGDDPGPLESWAFDAPESDYVILNGAPRASGRLDAGGPGHTTRTGVWRCTPGVFTCTEQGDELMTILSGRGEIADHTAGEVTAFGPGDTLFSHDGHRVTWTIHETVTKVFHAHKPGGY